ncbi:MFS general substrate transporter [Mycena sp. CBHHK59/15]|nr:MFS general substrate transporter [Mycena sp. CBHHK59/15]
MTHDVLSFTFGHAKTYSFFPLSTSLHIEMEAPNAESLYAELNGMSKKRLSDPKVEEIETIPSLSQNVDDFPDGGLRACIVLVGTFSCFFATFGYVNSWGVFQAYYQQKLLRHSTPSEMCVVHAMIFIPSVFVGRLFDIGFFRIPFTAGTILIVVATFLIPQCKVYWHFMLCQGFGIGVGSGLMFCALVSIVTHWWKRKRGLALGITTCGGALGATIFPVIIRQLITKIGFPWAMRALGFILSFILFIGNACVARRLSPVKAPGGLFGLHVFRNSIFTVFFASTIILFLGQFTMLTYITSSAIEFGISPNFAFYLVSVVNFSSGIGRVVCGSLGDRFGAMNVIIIMSVFTGITTLAWPFCRTVATTTIISVLYGFSSGAWIALIGSVIGQMGGIEDIGRRFGAINAAAGLGTLCGPPLSGLFQRSSLGYKAVGYFAGSAILVGTGLTLVSRLLAVRGFWRKY